ncbi:hypothetical protein GCM10010207_80890 [Streptomyces atratus]|nr:hypothetical protein GCM10010207_80890 [Streptomyces atratus]
MVRASPTTPISAAQTSRVRTACTPYGADGHANAGSIAKGSSSRLANAPQQANSIPEYVEPRSSGRIPLIIIGQYGRMVHPGPPPIGGAFFPAFPRCAPEPPDARIVP